jgi:hypothetical protein
MKVKDLRIGPSDNTPEIILKSQGLIIIRGRGLIVNKIVFYDQVSEWVSNYIKDPPEITRVVLAFEYLNSFSLSFVVAILKTLKSVLKGDDFRLSGTWYLEEDDEDLMERGLYLAHVTDLPLKFVQVPEISEFNRTNPFVW